jgi:ribosome-associated translation inhibitor RaiA
MIGIRGVKGDRALRTKIRTRLEKALERLGVAPINALVTFVDDNGPKGGPAQRCALTVRLPYRPAIRVEQSATTSRLAFDAAFAALTPRLERYRERQREARRYPKKYYAAKRLLAGE